MSLLSGAVSKNFNLSGRGPLSTPRTRFNFPFSLFRCSAVLICAGLWVPPLAAQAPEKPLERVFQPGTETSYRVELTLRSSVEGPRAISAGEKAYAEEFLHSAEFTLRWRATRQVKSAGDEAEITEFLDQFSVRPGPMRSASEEELQLQTALRAALEKWTEGGSITLRYRESQTGKLLGLSAQAAPVLDESPAVLSLWLARALRPTVALPQTPFRFGSRWGEPRAVQLPPWEEVAGTETGEWLEPMPLGSGTSTSAAVARLHIVQHISGRIPSASAGSAAGRATFHTDSLTQMIVSGIYALGETGEIDSATRSASREIVRTLAPIPGLADPPVFRASIKAQIRIQQTE